MPRWILLVLAFLLVNPVAPAQQKRRIFVLHSGMHLILAPKDKNHAARTMKERLVALGIPERDLVPLESPFPTATIKNAIPRDGLMLYLECTDPASRSAQDCYLRMHKALEAQGVTKNDDLVWIGHSAGGQIGMSMAHLAHNLHKYEELAKKTQPYHFDTVITLGSAVGSNPVPAEVKLRHYYSEGDTVVYVLSKHGNLVAEAMKSKVVFCPCCDLKENAKVRVFAGIEHNRFYQNADVWATILREFKGESVPAWRRTRSDLSPGIGIGQLITEALDAQLGISLEEPRH